MTDLNSINIRALQFFIAVFESQSFSVVARRHGVSASMVSRVIHQLEDALGQQLFYRNTRAVIATEAGRLFIDYARSMTEQLGALQTELQDRALEPTGLVRINAPVFFGQRHIAPWLAGLAKRHPKLQIDLTQTDDFIDPHRDAADVLFRIGPLTDSSFHARVIGKQHYYLAAAPSYIEKHGALNAPQQLNQHQALVYRGSSGPNRWLFRKTSNTPGTSNPWTQIQLNPRLISNNAETLLIAALNGMGLVLFPDWLIGDCLQKGQLVRVLPQYKAVIHTDPHHIAAIYPHVRHPPLNVRAVIDYFVEVYGTPLYWQVPANSE